jgi:hypothetical protein
LKVPDKIVPDVGIYYDTPMESYHNVWDALSNSQITRFRRSPAHLKAYLEEPQQDSRALTIGRAIHTTILEPDSFDSNFTVAGQCEATKKDGARCTNAGLQLHNALGWLCGTHANGKGIAYDWCDTQFVLPPADLELCKKIRDSVFMHSSAGKLLFGDNGANELSLSWRDPETGVPCKARIDHLNPVMEGGAIVDIKSARDASEDAFMRAIFEHGYHRAAAHYLAGCAEVAIPAAHWMFVAVEKEPPYAVGVYRLTEGAIDAGRDQVRKMMPRYADCRARNVWPAYADRVVDIAIPDYGWSKIEQELQKEDE